MVLYLVALIYPVSRNDLLSFPTYLQFIHYFYLVNELEKGLTMNNDEFVLTYGAEKPPKDAVVIFSCLGGQYAQMGADLAKKLGWTK